MQIVPGVGVARGRARRIIAPVVAPRVVAHRGSSASHAEHTRAAYERALVEGVDGLECDVRLTVDGHLVCLHDRTLSRTSDARGRISETPLADLQTADFGNWATDLPESADDLVGEDRFDAYDRVRVPVLALEELLGLVADCGRRVDLLVETKHPTRYGGLVEQRLVETLRHYAMLDSRVSVMSFATSALRRTRRLAPELPTVQLMSRVPLLYRDGSLPVGADVAGPSVDILRAHPRYVERVHAAGHPLFVWTVDAPSDIDLVLGLGVDAVITNQPAEVLARLRQEAG
ncbi:MAG: glycerophosphodiester phosphodiesterase [Geodermatophilaceae bacterium]|nr:glycerophosphodiester phosphodiesterase [Geodermatophilaceae bacterium]